MSQPAFLEIAIGDEEPRFVSFDNRNRAYRAELRRQAASSLKRWLAEYGCVLSAAETEDADRTIRQLAAART